MSKWGIDMAFGLGIRSHFQDMKDHGMAFGIIRVGQGLYHAIDNIIAQVAAFTDFAIPYALYYAIHPWYSATRQVDRFLANWQGANPKSVLLDDELHGTETAIDRDNIYHDAYDYLHQKIGANYPVVGNYSGYWFIEAYVPMMKYWLGVAPYWNASYFVFQPKTWAQFQSMLDAHPTPQYVGYPKVAMWQFSSGLTPMVPHDVDYNRIDDLAIFQYLFNNGPLPIILPPPSAISEIYQVIVETLTVRAGPGTQWPVVYYLHKSDTKTVFEKTGNWGRFATGRWMNCGTAYCRRVA